MDKARIKKQVERFRKGFPWMTIVDPATPGKGICVLDEKMQEEALTYAKEHISDVKGACKFVPASGAASRMFKDIFAGMAALEEGTAIADDSALARLTDHIGEFAFYDPAVFPADKEDKQARRLEVARKMLTADGLNYGSCPKGVIRFHRYPDGECRTAFAEHLVEGQAYMRNADGSVNLTVTISPEHRPLFEAALQEVKDAYEKRYGVNYNVRFTYQDPQTDTVAVDSRNKPILKEDGTPLMRPAGHGALIFNLNDVQEELVSIKNIDNVASERLLPDTARWKTILIGRALMLRERIFGYLEELDMLDPLPSSIIYPRVPAHSPLINDDPYATDEAQLLCNEIEEFLRSELCVEIPLQHDCRGRVEALREKLNRPIRVCGMVRNQGESGGGPFIIKAKDGSTSLQILEGVQIDKSNPASADALSRSTHFNPVDIVCCIRDYKGEKFNLPDFVDEEAGFISSKSYKGRELKALELPGLWNGSMSDWNTAFVEVPLDTFNPVKTVLDLLRPAHR
ncbi:MAG: DUF4301 family protein [Bacteroidales bacterium]|nr:DUF4301 family protein [Bacteroidales bacterium]